MTASPFPNRRFFQLWAAVDQIVTLHGYDDLTDLLIRLQEAMDLDDAGGFVSESRRKYRRFQILALPEHYLGTVEADRFP